MVDLTFIAKKEANADQINEIVKKAANSTMNEVLRYVDEPLVSIDFNHTTHSSCFDSTLTKANGKLIKVSAWYDNEWAFSYRMLDNARLISAN